MNFIAVKDFEHFQHYKGRTPPWIKFYNALLDDYRFLQLPDAARSQLMLIWLVASRHKNRIPNDEKYIAQAIHCTSKLQLGRLLDSGWLYQTNDAPVAERKQDASRPLAERSTSATLEEEEEEEGEVEKEIEKEEAVTPPRVVLPKEAEKFLSLFYEPATTEAARKRYSDVKKQLFDALDPLHPGPKIRGGIRSHARSAEHLAEEMRVVMKDPPIDRDMAIVWLLKRLTNPPKVSPTEQASKREAEIRNLENRYNRAAAQAAIQWENEHKEEAQKIIAAVDRNYANAGDWGKPARNAELTQRLSREAGFPTFEKWCEQQQSNLQPSAA